MSRTTTSLQFHENARNAVRDTTLRRALQKSTGIFQNKRAAAVARIPLEALREKASDIRLQVLNDLPAVLDAFSAAATRAGAVVHRARDAAAARNMVLDILRDRRVRKIVKAKSMVTEEIELNPHLETHGMEVIETDLGEYIVQLAGETPSHILAPAIHKNRQQIGRLFSEKLGAPYSEDPKVFTKIARKALREDFLAADAGITGANFATADTGSLVMFTNEGNGRMVTTLPKLHVAVLTVEKMIPSLADLPTFIRLLPRSASGQAMSSYLSLITGKRKPGETTGAEELHIVLLDNGRFEINRGEYREILKCIRCSACINVCPVYAAVGGHAYGATYSGPMGIILTVLLEGMDKAHPLLDGTTLCGQCGDVCPVKVPLPKLLAMLRERRVEEGYTPTSERLGMTAMAMAWRSAALFSGSQSAIRTFWSTIAALGGRQVMERLPVPAERPLRRRMW